MAKKLKGPQMIVANRLTDGRAVFFTAQDDWSADLEAVLVVEEDGIDAALARALDFSDRNIVVSVEAIEADTSTHPARPAHMKPLMQAKGPTVRPDLGYQTGTHWEA